jgi:dolichol-phosphate mannosyltransferase
VRRWTAPAAYVGLALVVAGPLLKPGLVLAVDLNLVPHPHLPTVYWGIPAGTHAGALNRLPIDLLFVGLGHLGAVAIGEKLLLLATVLLAGWGMHRLAPARGEAGRYFAGLLYAINPFVYDRLYTGQWFLLLGYALLPWAFAAFLPLAAGRWRSAWRFALFTWLVGVASPHMFALLGVLVLSAAAATLTTTRRRGRTIGAIGLGCGLTLLASLYWLVPTPGLQDLWRHVGAAQLQLYQTVADPTWGLGATVAGLYGYWNDTEPIRAHLAAWPLVAAALVALAAWGLAVRRRQPIAWAVAGAAAFGFLLALGGRGPLTGSLFRTALEHLGVARSFREPQKGVALLVFGYAYLGSLAVSDLRAHAPAAWRRAGAAVVTVSLLALPLLGGFRELGGLWGSMTTSSYPQSWSETRALLDQEATGSRTLVLPWHGYLALSFAGHRVVANPAPGYFDVPILASRSVGEGTAATDNSDPLERYVLALLARARRTHDLGACLAPLGVSHVLLAKEADWARYGFLSGQRDLVVERRWKDLVLYRNVHPSSLAMEATAARATPCGPGFTPLRAELLDPAHVRLEPAPPPGALVVFGNSFRSDWSLGETRSRAFAGAVNAFRTQSPEREISLGGWRGLERNYILGLIGLALVAASSVARRDRNSCAPFPPPRDVGVRSRPLWVVVPTYNEAENLRSMVGALLRTFDEGGLDGNILVVDDASPDGTGAIADELAGRHPAIHVLHRSAKTGLGRAYLEGFEVALTAGAGLIVQMDCDFSHDPGDVVRLVEATDQADVVLGSRYTAGGRVENWGLARRAVSRLGCAYARHVLGLGVRDLTGGFKCFRCEALRSLDLASVEANGYGFQIETTYRASLLRLAIVEVPIIFRDRTAGSSKMSWRIAAEALWLVARLRLRSPKQWPAPPPRAEPSRTG